MWHPRSRVRPTLPALAQGHDSHQLSGRTAKIEKIDIKSERYEMIASIFSPIVVDRPGLAQKAVDRAA